MRGAPLFLLVAIAVSGCFDDQTPPLDGDADRPVIEEPAWDAAADRVEIAWRWGGEVDAFNAIVARDGVHDAQVELSEQTRSMVVIARGASVVTLSVQACNKGILKSTCTPWAYVEARPPR